MYTYMLIKMPRACPRPRLTSMTTTILMINPEAAYNEHGPGKILVLASSKV